MKTGKDRGENVAKTLHLGKSVADNGWGVFTGFLQYKLEEEGKYLVKVDDAVGNIRLEQEAPISCKK